jgi:hypothetical protein
VLERQPSHSGRDRQPAPRTVQVKTPDRSRARGGMWCGRAHSAGRGRRIPGREVLTVGEDRTARPSGRLRLAATPRAADSSVALSVAARSTRAQFGHISPVAQRSITGTEHRHAGQRTRASITPPQRLVRSKAGQEDRASRPELWSGAGRRTTPQRGSVYCSIGRCARRSSFRGTSLNRRPHAPN